MAEILHREFVYLWYYFTLQLGQIFPYWVLGMVLGSAISVFAKGSIHALFGRLQTKRLDALGLIPASVLGIASPLCMYGTIPLAASFSRLGMKDDLLAAFMMSSILLNPQLIIYSAALGPTALAVRILSCFLCGIAAGLLVRWFYRDKSFFNFDGFDGPGNRDTDPNLLLRFLKNLGRNLKATGPYFLFGIVLSALFQRYVPAEAMTAVFGGNEAFGVLMAAYDRRAARRLRRGNHPAAAAVAGRRDEHGQRGCLHADRPLHQDHQPRCAENCAGDTPLCALPIVCNGVFLCHRLDGQPAGIKKEKETLCSAFLPICLEGRRCFFAAKNRSGVDFHILQTNQKHFANRQPLQ